ncbi:hypothetical protein EVAR_5892_1 [Eumeta japonica]|uniref:Uncharacterized protein n=1 Tax=Eumeta variegata TaxID=151549 RepID=A0A4C1TC10_EUMVA|nr:hypothetical protein EVAR_5892_1 [Eumeta japonica]
MTFTSFLTRRLALLMGCRGLKKGDAREPAAGTEGPVRVVAKGRGARPVGEEGPAEGGNDIRVPRLNALTERAIEFKSVVDKFESDTFDS